MKQLIDRLEQNHKLSREEYRLLLESTDEDLLNYSCEKARKASLSVFGNKIYIRGLIELTNYCRNDCYYCGIRRSNREASRYRLTPEDIWECCRQGYDLGFRTFVLQGGEDMTYTREVLCGIIETMRKDYPDCAITLSIGERSREDYEAFYKAGADRFLLRHETASPEHYARLHPENLTLKNRMSCLRDLKDIGYQTGTGFMVGSPWQTINNLADDLFFIQEFQPQMVGIGPFIPQHDTPFRDFPAGTMEQTLFLLSLLRLMMPNVLLPSTTALGTIHPEGREQGILAGANVVMPNLSPVSVRKKYLLYDNKICTDEEAAESIEALRRRLQKIGYDISVERGDYCG